MLPEWACRSEVLVEAGLLGDKGFGVVGALISSTCLLGLAEIFKAKSDQSVKKRIFCILQPLHRRPLDCQWSFREQPGNRCDYM